MKLIVPGIPDPIPVDVHRRSHQPDGDTIDIRMPENDPEGLRLMPGTEAVLIEDNGSTQDIILGRSWTTLRSGSVVRIGIRQRPRPGDPSPVRTAEAP